MHIPAFIPLGANRVWRTYPGGRTLDKLEGKAEPGDSHFPEDWIASTTRATNKGREDVENEGLATVDIGGGPQTVRSLIEQHPETMVGESHFAEYGPELGVLVKFLDSAVRLHIQAHPTVRFSQQHLNANYGKTEGYVILGAREEVSDRYIYFGFQNPPTREEYRRAIVEQDSAAILAPFEKIPVKAGDVFLVPGGLPHAIGEGVFMIEIMEPSDFAVRLEFERGGYVLPEAARFMGRDVDFALDMMNFERLSVADLKQRYFGSPREVARYGGGVETSLIDRRLTECFQVRRLSVKGELRKREPGFYVAIVSKGEGVIGEGEAERPVKFGDRFFVPAATDELRYASAGGMEVTLALPPSAA